MPALFANSVKVLRVAVVAMDGARREELHRMIVAAGHRIVVATSEADVAICDGETAVTGAAPIITLGVADSVSPGSLPRDANADQIDAAIRAVAAG